MSDRPTHPMTQIERALALADRFAEEIAPTLRCIDWLAEYCEWLTAQGIVAEGADGWPTPAVYDEANIAAFIADWHEDAP